MIYLDRVIKLVKEISFMMSYLFYQYSSQLREAAEAAFENRSIDELKNVLRRCTVDKPAAELTTSYINQLSAGAR